MFCENKTYPNLLLQTLEDVPPILDPKAAPSRRSLLGSPSKLNRKHALKKTEPSRSQPQPPTAPRSLLGSLPLSLRRPGSPLALSHAFTAKHGQPSRPRTTKKPSKHKKAGRDSKAPKCSVVFNLVDIPPPEISDVVDESTRKSGNTWMNQYLMLTMSLMILVILLMTQVDPQQKFFPVDLSLILLQVGRLLLLVERVMVPQLIALTPLPVGLLLLVERVIFLKLMVLIALPVDLLLLVERVIAPQLVNLMVLSASGPPPAGGEDQD